MIVLVVAFSWVAEVGMGIHPYYFQVLVVGVEGVESGRSDCVVSSHSQHDTIRMFLQTSEDAIVDLSQQIVQQLQVPHVMVSLLFIDLGRFVVDCADIAQIDGFNLVLFLEGFEEVGLPEDIRSSLDTLDVLPLPNGSTEEKQLLARGHFDLFTRNHATETANNYSSNKQTRVIIPRTSTIQFSLSPVFRPQIYSIFNCQLVIFFIFWIVIQLIKVEMSDLVVVKGLKGKQNKKKWAKNIDVSGLLQAQARMHDEQIRQRFQQDLIVTDDHDRTRAPLDPNRFKQTVTQLPKKVYNNKITRDLNLKAVDDVWDAPDQARHLYKHPEVPSVIAPESGHSYNPREEDIEKLKDRIIDFEASKPIPRKVKPKTELPEVAIRYRNKKKRQAQLAERERKQEKEFKQQLHHIKKIKKAIEEKEVQIQEGIKTKAIKKQKLIQEERTGLVRKGRKLGKKAYRFKEYIPTEEKAQKLSKVSLSDQLVRERFDTIYRRGIFQPRNVKVHANRRKHIKVKERGFIEQ